MVRVRHILHPIHTFNSFFRRLWNRQYAQIGLYRIHLPWNSQWLSYRRRFRLQDSVLGRIASVLKVKYPSLYAVDVGANVGDTAALIRESGEIPVLCVEGDPVVLKLLRENVARMGPGVAIEPSFVGPDGNGVNLNSAVDLGRNASIIRAADPSGPVRLRSLRAILTDHPEFARPKLLKTDTEGFDFEIIRQSIDLIRSAKPAVFFEYNPNFRPEEPHAGIETIQALIGAGYSHFIYYDNYGNFLLHCDASNGSAINDLDAYLGSNHRHGAAVLYFDICALHQDDADLLPKIKSCTQR